MKKLLSIVLMVFFVLGCFPERKTCDDKIKELFKNEEIMYGDFWFYDSTIYMIGERVYVCEVIGGTFDRADVSLVVFRDPKGSDGDK